MDRFTALNFILLLLLICSFGEDARCQEAVVTPRQIVQRMAEQYSTISSYQDYGVVETIENKTGRRRPAISFKTYFMRPQLFRFQWVEHGSLAAPGRNIIWYDGKQSYSYYAIEPDKVEKEKDLSSAIAGATGVSLGSAYTVPTLLIKDDGGFRLTDLKNLSLSGQERFEGEDCYVLKGTHPSGETYEFWISKRDYLLRKLREPLTDVIEESIYRDIKINERLAAETFQIKPTPLAAATNIASKEKEAEIRRLIDLSIPRQQVAQGIDEALGALKGAMPKVPEKIWQEVIGEVGFNADRMMEVYVPLLDQHYTEEEIKQLIDFYSTPLGMKVSRSMVLIELNAFGDVQRKIKGLIQEVLEKLKARGYEGTVALGTREFQRAPRPS